MSSPQQLFRLHWKNHSPNFITCFSQLLNSESLVDVTLAADGKQIQAHRVVLSACSTYFQELFVTHSCQHPIVILKDINFKDLCTVIHFMYYGEVNIQHDQLDSILKAAEVLRIKGFSDVADKESFSSALLNERDAYRASMTRQASTSTEQQSMNESIDDGSGASSAKRKRQQQTSVPSLSKASQERPAPQLLVSHQQQHRRDTFQSISREGSSSFRSSIGSFDSSSVIKSQSSLVGQSSVESNAGEECCGTQEGDVQQSQLSPSAIISMENGGSSAASSSTSASSQTKQKRNRTLIRQERITRKEAEKDPASTEGGRASPIIHVLQPILPKSPSSTETDTDIRPRTQTATTTTTTYLQLPQSTTTQLIRQRSQPSPGTISLLSTPSSSSGRASQTPPPPQSLSFLSPTSIPTLAVTPVSSAPNIVIEQYPTILRVVSIEEMNMASDFQASASIPVLSRTPSQSASNTLQVPSISLDPAPEPPTSSVHLGSTRPKVKSEDLRRSVSNPGVSVSSPSTGGTQSTSTSSNGHCPVLRTGAALGCNFCWNTNDSHGRILRRKTKYHCPDCQANLCIVPCFQAYHEKFVSSPNEASGNRPSGPSSQQKNSASSHQQVLSKMSSI